VITLFSRLRSGYRHGIQSLHDILRSLSITGKIIFAVFATLFVASSIFMLFEVNNSFLVAVPRIGGTLTEGVIGQPRFINPLLAVTDADNDLAALIYSGLMRHDTEGKLIPDLAERFTVSEDGKMYDFFLRNNATFHDGKPVTADDIVFTIGLIQNPNIQSPHLSDWAGVKVQKISDKQIRFILLAPYVPFLENTTIGILPKHLWQTYTSPDTFPLANINVQPVGSGPYKMYGVKKGGDNMALSYTLVPFKNFVLGTPYISTLVINFYSDQRQILDIFIGN
jgi:peptide/nickel transport system substrate-binding protein